MRKACVFAVFVLLGSGAIHGFTFAQSAVSGDPVFLRPKWSAGPSFLLTENSDVDEPVRSEPLMTDVDTWQPYDAGTIAVQTAFGAVGGAVLFTIGYGVDGWHTVGMDKLAYLFAGYVLGTVVGAPLGVYAGGSIMGGDGAFWPTMLLGLVGSGLGVTALGVSREREISIPLFVIATLAPPIVAYHESAAYKRTHGRIVPATDGVSKSGGADAVPMSVFTRLRFDPIAPRSDVLITLLRVPL